MGVVVKAVDKTLAHVFVNHRVMSYVVCPFLELFSVWKIAIQQQVSNFEIIGLLCELFDRVAAITQDSFFAVDVSYR